jgi:hypothetical protein
VGLRGEERGRAPSDSARGGVGGAARMRRWVGESRLRQRAGRRGD